jgi:hypothetical protein
VYAALDVVTDIHCARVAVITAFGIGNACAFIAGVAFRAEVTVLTGRGVVFEGAATCHLCIAYVVGAGVAVVAIGRARTFAITIETGVTRRARVAVFTGTDLGELAASFERFALIQCARVVIVAVLLKEAGQTVAVGARVGKGTGIAIFAEIQVRDVDTANVRHAHIGSAWVPVVAVWLLCSRNALALNTSVVGSARVSIIAGAAVRNVFAASVGGAIILRAVIAVGTDQHLIARHAVLVVAVIVQRAQVTVFAGARDGRVYTAFSLFAPIGRTGVVVVA